MTHFSFRFWISLMCKRILISEKRLWNSLRRTTLPKDGQPHIHEQGKRARMPHARLRALNARSHRTGYPLPSHMGTLHLTRATHTRHFVVFHWFGDVVFQCHVDGGRPGACMRTSTCVFLLNSLFLLSFFAKNNLSKYKTILLMLVKPVEYWLAPFQLAEFLFSC